MAVKWHWSHKDRKKKTSEFTEDESEMEEFSEEISSLASTHTSTFIILAQQNTFFWSDAQHERNMVFQWQMLKSEWSTGDDIIFDSLTLTTVSLEWYNATTFVTDSIILLTSSFLQSYERLANLANFAVAIGSYF